MLPTKSNNARGTTAIGVTESIRRIISTMSVPARIENVAEPDGRGSGAILLVLVGSPGQRYQQVGVAIALQQ